MEDTEIDREEQEDAEEAQYRYWVNMFHEMTERYEAALDVADPNWRWSPQIKAKALDGHRMADCIQKELFFMKRLGAPNND